MNSTSTDRSTTRPATRPRREPEPTDARGVFVTFEGIEGSGKTTQIARVADRARDAGRDVVVTREPGGTSLGRDLRAILLAPREPTMSPEAELLLYAADRAEHLVQVVEPALARGAVVLCDRYLDATLAYQGYGRGLGTEPILAIHCRPPLDRRPDRTVLLDLDPFLGVRRARERNREDGSETAEGRFEAEDYDFHTRVRDGYLALSRQCDRIRVVDADGTVDEVHHRVWHAVSDLCGSAGT